MDTKFKSIKFTDKIDDNGTIIHIASMTVGSTKHVYQIAEVNGKFTFLYDGHYDTKYDSIEDAMKAAETVHQEKMAKRFEMHKNNFLAYEAIYIPEVKDLEFAKYNAIDAPDSEDRHCIWVARQEIPGFTITYYISETESGKYGISYIDGRLFAPVTEHKDTLEEAKECANSINNRILTDLYKELKSQIKFISQYFKE